MSGAGGSRVGGTLPRDIGVADPVRLPSRAPEREAAGAVPAIRLAGDARGSGKTAVLVCHGMGQQVPFETLSVVAEALAREEAAQSGAEPPAARVRFALLGDQWLPRAELRVGGAGAREVHVYEGYWAPLAEGKVRAGDVTRFLWDAGVRGLGYALGRSFTRWIFGRPRSFPLGVSTAALLALAFVLFAAVLVAYAVVLVLGGAAIVGALLPAGSGFGHFGPLLERLALDLATSPLVLSILLVPVGLPSWGWRIVGYLAGAAILAGGVRHLVGDAWLSAVRLEQALLALALVAALGLAFVGVHRAMRRVGWVRQVVEVAATGLAVGAAVWMIVAGARMALTAASWLAGDLEAPARTPGGWFYALLLASSAYGCVRMRSLYIQYLGDVAAYVSSHRVNRFHELRAAVKKVGHDLACAVYGALREDGRGFEYDHVVVVGHSLGSVVAYDTLNGMINHDRSRGGGLDVVGRTPTLLTFGSPLDKTAFIFRTQVEDAPIREALASAVQPLIWDTTTRGPEGIRWINLWSRRDPVSGPLEFYDPPPGQEPPGHRRVENVEDPDAWVPIAAHTRYWTSRAFSSHLHRALVGASVPDSGLGG